jgi:multisubunit Na+/H+ antiporter MnhC subunit
MQHVRSDRSPMASRRSPTPYALVACLGLILVGIFLYQEWRTTGRVDGVSYDDSWIHYRFAHNLRQGNGFSFNPGEASTGATSPLWVLLLSAIDAGYLIPSKAIGSLSYIGIGFAAYVLGVTLGLERVLALAAGLLALSIGRLAWISLSGMETTTFTLLALISMIVWYRRRENIPLSFSILVGVSALIRPEGYLLIGCSGVAWLLAKDRRTAWLPMLMALGRHFLIAGLIISPYLLFSYLNSGSPLPSTHAVVSSVCSWTVGESYPVWVLSIFLLDNPIILIIAGLGIFVMLRKRMWKEIAGLSLLLGWWVSLPLAYGFIAPCTTIYSQRYSIPVSPVTPLVAMLGLQHLSDLRVFQRLKPARLKLTIIIAALVIGIFLTAFFWAPLYGNNVHDIRTMHEQIGLWLRENTNAGDLIAANDIGAIGYLSGRKILDLVGLVDQETLQATSSQPLGQQDWILKPILEARKPAYLVIFPNWYPGLVRDLPLENVFSVRLENRTIATGEEMIVYRLHW